MCAHAEPAYLNEPWRCGPASGVSEPSRYLRESERATRESVILPLYPGMTEEQQQEVAASLAHRPLKAAI